jgi:hypothetical protein
MPELKPTKQPPFRAGPVRRAFHTLVAVAGWALFLYWWWLVAHRVGRQEVVFTLVFIAIALGLIVGLTALWAFHNLRIFEKRGNRRQVSHVTAAPSEDSVGRHVQLPTLPEDCRNSPIVTVRIHDGDKVYASSGVIQPPARPSGLARP